MVRHVQRMVCTERWKLIVYPQIKRKHLFDLADDPNELKDLSADPRHGATLAELRKELETWQNELGDPLVGR